MKSKPKNFRTPRDTPATRKQRLQQRLQEINAKGEQEIAALLKNMRKVKATLKSKKK